MRKARNTSSHIVRLDVDELAERILDDYLKSLGAKSKANAWCVRALLAAIPRPELRVPAPRIERTKTVPVASAPAVANSYQNDSSYVRGPVAWSDDEPTYAPIEDNA